MKAEYNKWYKCQEGQMPEDFENVVLGAKETRFVIVQTIYNKYNEYHEGIDWQCRTRYDIESEWQWEEYTENEILAWLLPAPYVEQ